MPHMHDIFLLNTFVNFASGKDSTQSYGLIYLNVKYSSPFYLYKCILYQNSVLFEFNLDLVPLAGFNLVHIFLLYFKCFRRHVESALVSI